MSINPSPLPSSYRWLEEFDNSKCMLKGESYLICKRVLDVAIVLVTMPLWILIIVLLALVIKIQSPRDPVFFIQQRTGKGGRRFAMYKFRTMVANAEELKEKYADLNELQWPDFKISNDPRVTKIGHFLRKTSLDELPQLFNILKGDMSLVGPRPTFFSPKKYDLWHTERLDARPGLTGLWQILGRGSVKFDERARLDIIYVEKRCLRLDLQILLHTIVVVLAQRGAH